VRGYKVHLRARTADLEIARANLGPEYEAVRLLAGFLRFPHILDAGAYIGTSSLALRKIFPDCKITLIEPSRENLKMIALNLSSLRKIEVLEGALSPKDGPVNLYTRRSGEIGNTIASETLDEKILKKGNSVTHGYTLEKIIKEKGEIDVLKLDIEGGEKEVFESSINALRSIPIIVCETHERFVQGCEAALHSIIGPGDLVVRSGEKVTIVRENFLQSLPSDARRRLTAGLRHLPSFRAKD
jgi:FkbM family methyltransferase